MPLTGVQNETSIRFAEARQLLTEIAAREAIEGTAVSAGLNVQKALFLVALYAAFEYSTNLLVVRTCEAITALKICHDDIATELFSLALDPELKSIASGGRKGKWKQRSALFTRASSKAPAHLHGEALLSELGNIWCTSLEQVFMAFGLKGPFLYDRSAMRYIDEVVDRRNAVAHGRETVSSVGSRYTAASLEVRMIVLERQKDYLISQFNPLIDDELYLEAAR